jgi:hypothetical protein
VIEAIMLIAAAAVAQPRDLACVATLAVATYQQQHGGASGRWPPLAEDGGRFAQWFGEAEMKRTGRTREHVRDAILAAVAERQKGGELDDSEVTACIARMREAAPPLPAPGLPQCAALLKLAYDEEHGRNGLSESAKRLATIASVLDHKAREALRSQGRSGTEADAAMAAARDTVAAELKARDADGVSAGLDYSTCLTLAAPR